MNHPSDNPNNVILKFMELPDSLTPWLPDSCTGFGPLILITLSVLSSSKKLNLQFFTLWPYLPILWAFPLPYSSHFTCLLASQSAQGPRLSHFSPSNAFPSPPILHSQSGFLNSPLTAHLLLPVSTTWLRKIPTLNQCSNPSPMATRQLHTAEKVLDVLRVGSTTYSWLQNSSESPVPPI